MTAPFFRRASLLALLAAFSLSGGLSGTASAQGFSDAYNFLKAVKDRDGEEVTKLVDEPGSVIINTRERSTNRTALHMVVERRDGTWLQFLLYKKANPELADRDGETPLHLAAQLGFVEGVKILLDNGAKVDPENKSGETPLIRAVQLRDAAIVRALLAKGANPDHSDSVAGMSAREYAERDDRSGAIATMIREHKAGEKPKDLDFNMPLFK